MKFDWKQVSSDIGYSYGDILLVDNTDPAKVYIYDPVSKSSIQASVPDIIITSSDIAHTSNKLWLYQYRSGPYTDIGEWDITLDPFTAVFNRYITNVKMSAGLSPIDDLTLNTFVRNVGYYSTDVTNDACVNTLHINYASSRNVTGDFMLTATGKFISIENVYAAPYTTYVVQYDYATGVKELEIDISSVFGSPWLSTYPIAYGLFEHQGDIFIAGDQFTGGVYSGVIYKIDKTTPYSLTPYDTTTYRIFGASQLMYRITGHFVV